MSILPTKIYKNLLSIMGKWIQIKLLGLCDKDMIMRLYNNLIIKTSIKKIKY